MLFFISHMPPTLTCSAHRYLRAETDSEDTTRALNQAGYGSLDPSAHVPRPWALAGRLNGLTAVWHGNAADLSNGQPSFVSDRNGNGAGALSLGSNDYIHLRDEAACDLTEHLDFDARKARTGGAPSRALRCAP